MHAAFAAEPDGPDEGTLDFAYAFFQNCHHLREWIELSRDIPSRELGDFVGRNPEVQACRDIANGTKHFHVTHPSVDAEFSIGRELIPFTDSWSYFVVAGQKYELLELANRCLQLWDDFLAGRNASSEHFYPGFSIFARDNLRAEVMRYRENRNLALALPDGPAKAERLESLRGERERLVRALQHVLDGPFSFDTTERAVLEQELRNSLDTE